MFDISRLRKGMDHLYQEISYDNVDKVNIFYKRTLLKKVPPKPKFFEKVDQKAVKTAVQAGDLNSLSLHDRNFLVVQDLLQDPAKYPRGELLTRMRRVTSHYPRDVRLVMTFARICMQSENYGDAVFFLQRATQLAPKSKYAWAHLALISAFAHDHGTALTASRQALELGEDLFSMMYKAYVFTLMAQGAASKAGPFDSGPLFKNRPIAEGELTRGRPEVVYHREPETLPDAPTVMFACDENYFNLYGKNQLLSLLQTEGKFGTHVHIVNPSDETFAWVDTYAERYCANLIVSYERIDEKLIKNKSYLASCRFINVPDFIRKFDRPYLIVDTDTILNSPAHLEGFFEQVKEPTAFYSEHSPVWDTVTAAFIYIPNTKIGLSYIDMVQRYLLRAFFTKDGTSFWYVDQMALQGATLAHAEHIQLATNRQVSCRFFSEDAIFWFLSTDKTKSKYHERAESLAKQYPMD